MRICRFVGVFEIVKGAGKVADNNRNCKKGNLLLQPFVILIKKVFFIIFEFYAVTI